MSLQCNKTQVQSGGCSGTVMFHKNGFFYKKHCPSTMGIISRHHSRGEGNKTPKNRTNEKKQKKSRKLAGRLLDIDAMQDNNAIAHLWPEFLQGFEAPFSRTWMCCVLSWFQLFGSVGYRHLPVGPELGLLVGSVPNRLRH